MSSADQALSTGVPLDGIPIIREPNAEPIRFKYHTLPYPVPYSKHLLTSSTLRPEAIYVNDEGWQMLKGATDG